MEREFKRTVRKHKIYQNWVFHFLFLILSALLFIGCFGIKILTGEEWDVEKEKPEVIWYVDYETDFSAKEADPDGGVIQWKPGYFIAHDWSENGRRIRDKILYVVVDRILYHYVSSKVCPKTTEWEDLESFVAAKEGIGFQTCYGDQLLVTHYEPENAQR